MMYRLRNMDGQRVLMGQPDMIVPEGDHVVFHYGDNKVPMPYTIDNIGDESRLGQWRYRTEIQYCVTDIEEGAEVQSGMIWRLNNAMEHSMNGPYKVKDTFSASEYMVGVRFGEKRPHYTSFMVVESIGVPNLRLMKERAEGVIKEMFPQPDSGVKYTFSVDVKRRN